MKNPRTIYSTKAEKYAKHRWDYASEAMAAIIETTRMTLGRIHWRVDNGILYAGRKSSFI